MNAAITYSTPIQSWDQDFFGTTNTITTKLPANTVLIRAIAIKAIAAYVCLVCLSTLTWCLPVLILSTAYFVWTINSNRPALDPMVAAFHQIVGGQSQFDQLPQLDLSLPHTTLSKNIEELQWDALEHSTYRAQTTDGRQILIVKALSKEPQWGSCQTKSIFAFVEKLGPYDLENAISNLSETNGRRFLSFIDAISFKGNTAGNTLKFSNFHSEDASWSHKWVVFSSINKELIDEMTQQLRANA